MPKVTGNDLVVQTLKNEGVDTVFYLTGGPMSDVAGLCLEMQFKSIDVRHEQAAAMMAHAYSRLTGKTGRLLCGLGAWHHQFTHWHWQLFPRCHPSRRSGWFESADSEQSGAFQEMGQVSIFKPVTKWAERVTDTRRVPELISKAVRMATQGQQGPVYLDLPGDILYTQVELDDVHFPRNLPKQPRPSGDAELIEEAVALLKQAKAPPHPDR
jgi:acetolactate synthase-1/2/3 large subunit